LEVEDYFKKYQCQGCAKQKIGHHWDGQQMGAGVIVEWKKGASKLLKLQFLSFPYVEKVLNKEKKPNPNWDQVFFFFSLPFAFVFFLLPAEFPRVERLCQIYLYGLYASFRIR
jgi:hypothetical protein